MRLTCADALVPSRSLKIACSASKLRRAAALIACLSAAARCASPSALKYDE